MSVNPIFWSSVGFWILLAGLIGDFLVLFVRSGRLEKTLAAIFTVLIAIGVAVEHIADARRFGPRVLTPAQMQSLVVKLKPFARQQFSLAVNPEPEPVALINQIDAVVRASGWHVIDPQVRSDVSLGKAAEVIATGVRIQFAPVSLSETIGRAKLLASALTDDGIPAVAESNPELTNASALNLVVGSKQ